MNVGDAVVQREAPMPPLLAFTSDHVRRLAGVAASTARYWEETYVFSATYIDETPHQPFRRLYTFRDLVGLRTLSMLRKRHKIPLDELRKVGDYLRQYEDMPWSSLRFEVWGRHIVFIDPVSGQRVSSHPFGQSMIPFELEQIAAETEREIRHLNQRRPEEYGMLARNRYVLGNAWTIAGTRIPTSAIWNYHRAGYNHKAIIRAYPELTVEDIESALDHEQAIADQSAA